MSDESVRHRALADNLAARLRCSHILWLKVIDRAMGADEGVRGGDSFGRRWERRIATGPGDVDRSYHLALRGSEYVRTACKGSWLADDATERLDNPPIPERCTACWRAAVQGDALALALIDACDEIQAEERAKEGLHEEAREEMVPRRIPDGTPGVRDPDAPCTDFDPGRAGAGRCDGDGHYLCAECRNRSSANVRDRAQPEPVVHIGLPGDNWGGDPIVVDDPDAEFAVDQHLTRLDSTPEVIALCEQPRDRDEELEVDLRFDVSDAEEPIGVHVPDYDFEGGAG